jgi:hypothetical protein
LRRIVTKINFQFKVTTMRKSVQVAALALNAALYVALGVLLSTILPINFGGVRFWPQVIVPAVFAVVFGPWVGGGGAAAGIFVSDVLLGNDPLLSLMAGITSNFLGFWLIGYIANKNINIKKATGIYGISTGLLAVIAYFYTSFIYVGIIIGCFVAYLVIITLVKAWNNSKWLSYEIGSVVGLLVGSFIIGIIVPVYAVLFAPGATAFPALTIAGVLSLFTWTFATEIPFLLVLGPPIIGAIYKAFPTLEKRKTQSPVNPSD